MNEYSNKDSIVVIFLIIMATFWLISSISTDTENKIFIKDTFKTIEYNDVEKINLYYNKNYTKLEKTITNRKIINNFIDALHNLDYTMGRLITKNNYKIEIVRKNNSNTSFYAGFMINNNKIYKKVGFDFAKNFTSIGLYNIMNKLKLKKWINSEKREILEKKLNNFKYSFIKKLNLGIKKIEIYQFNIDISNKIPALEKRNLIKIISKEENVNNFIYYIKNSYTDIENDYLKEKRYLIKLYSKYNSDSIYMILNKNINAKSSITLLKTENNKIIEGINSNYAFKSLYDFTSMLKLD